MKFAITILGACLLLNVVQSEDIQFMTEMMECGQEMGITIDQIKDMMEKKDEKLGCVNACVLKKIGAMVDGKLHEENLAEMVEKHKDLPNYQKMKEHLDKCTGEIKSGGDMEECQLAGKFGACMKEGMQGELNSMMLKALQLGMMAQGGIGQLGAFRL